VFTNDYSLKPGKNPRIFPPKSRGNPRHFRKISGNFRKFRKIPEVVPGKSSLLEVGTTDYSLKSGKNPQIFPPKSRGNPGNPENSGNPGNPGNPENFVSGATSPIFFEKPSGHLSGKSCKYTYTTLYVNIVLIVSIFNAVYKTHV